MNQSVEIPVYYKRENLLFKASVQPIGYIPRIDVDINVSHFIFGQDEEGKYRALESYDNLHNKGIVDMELLTLIKEVLDSVR